MVDRAVVCAILKQLISTALATSCQVYPSEYAYWDDSVTRAESTSANCRRYPLIPGLPIGVMAHNLNWLILILDLIQSTSVVVVTTSGLLVVLQGNCYSYSPQESP